MKRTSTISLGGMNFNIDDDAYDILSQYLTKLSDRFPKDEKEEILQDIEARMAELFIFKLHNRNVININDVNEVIDVIGHPDQFDDESGNSSEVNSSKEKNYEEKDFTTHSRKEYRKLYRNSTDKVIGGVASGLAAYFNLDPVVTRILFVVLAIASLGWGIFIYLIFLIAMPEATTKAQLLEMQGIEPSLENIDNFNQVPAASKNSSILGNILKAILIIIGITIAIILSFCVIGIAIAIYVGLLTYTPGEFGSFADIALLVSCGLFCLCPVIGIVVLCVRAFRNGERKHKWVGWTLLAIWILSLFGMIGFGIETGKNGNVDRRIEKTAHRLADKWNDKNHDYYINFQCSYDEEDSGNRGHINDSRQDLNNEEEYDISTQSHPVVGTNVHIKSKKTESDTFSRMKQ